MVLRAWFSNNREYNEYLSILSVLIQNKLIVIIIKLKPKKL